MEIQLFNNPQFGEIRTTGTAEAPLFCLADICKALGLDSSKVSQRLPEGVRSKHPLKTAGGIQQVTFVSESGLYQTIFQSRRPEAEVFTSWVTEEVLPSIRKTGGYIPVKPEETPQETLSRAFLIATETIKQREQRIKMLAEDNARKQALLEEQKPKVVFADAIVGGKTNILIRDLAKLIQQNGYEIGEKRLFIWLRDNKYLTISNMPMQRYVEMGLFFVDEGSHSESGVMKCHFTTKVTPKGQQYFVNKFLGNGNKEN